MSTKPFAPLTFPSLANPERDAVMAEARIAGHAAGYAEGMAVARTQLAAEREAAANRHLAAAREAQIQVGRQLGVLGAVTDSLSRLTAPVLEELHAALLAASIDIAESLLSAELSTAETSARTALARSLHEAPELGTHTVRLNPHDLEALDAESRAAAGVTLVADPTLAAGDAVAEYEAGFLDARLTTALTRARTALEEVIHG